MMPTAFRRSTRRARAPKRLVQRTETPIQTRISAFALLKILSILAEQVGGPFRDRSSLAHSIY